MAYLLIQQGDAEDRRVEIDSDEVTVGRADDNTIVIDDPAASSHHCSVVREESRFTLRDHNSTNGTYLNGAAVKECPLAPDDVITVGSVRMTIEGADIATAETPIIPDTGPQNTIRASAVQASAPAFEVRRKRTGLYVTLVILIVVGIGSLLFFFLRGLLGM